MEFQRELSVTKNATQLAQVSDHSYTTHVIKHNLLIISTICNIFSLTVCLVIIYNFLSAISRAREDRQKRKQKLYFNSALLIFFISLLIVALLLVPYFPAFFFLGDIAMDVTVAFILLFWWTQWKQSVYLHIQNKFIQLLTSYEEKQR